MISQVRLYWKNWLVNPVTGALENVDIERPDFNWETYEEHPHKSSWDRDIVAARCILIKGKRQKLICQTLHILLMRLVFC